MDDVVVMTDFGSTEGSLPFLTRAVQRLTGRTPVVIDARHFYDGGAGIVEGDGVAPILEVPADGLRVRPASVIIYEIPPDDRHRLARFQRVVQLSRVACLGAAAAAWHAATDKQHAVERFRAAGIRQMESIVVQRPSISAAREAFERLGRDVWARPAIGLGGRDVFHVTNDEQLQRATAQYAATGQKFLLTRDARNVDEYGRRHQYRVVVLGDRVLRVCEHVQSDPDRPCNEAQGASSALLPPETLPRPLATLAIEATRALGLAFGGVDLAAESGGRVFEVNVHPVLTGERGFETIALPFVRAHLATPAPRARRPQPHPTWGHP
ncbi:ATP-grasp domain-containing protein [Nocardia nepalensis]|uniref:ATP-grasp domain-containing protein n=1 Tax=Nocardia nepalensis TaxID=3375448 RepID=UPI003B681FF0